jgi:hypothetical protein
MARIGPKLGGDAPSELGELGHRDIVAGACIGSNPGESRSAGHGNVLHWLRSEVREANFHLLRT